MGSDPVTFLASITSALTGVGVVPVADHAGMYAAPISKLDIKAAAVVFTIFMGCFKAPFDSHLSAFT
jgi:hypothetical protein